MEENKEVYIFALNFVMRYGDMEQMRQELKRQIEDGVVLHDARTKFVKREILIEGRAVTVELTPKQIKPFTLEELEDYRAGAGGLRAAVIVADLLKPESENVSAILDWDFREKELVAVWGYGSEPYRARDYKEKWVAYPLDFAGAGQEELEGIKSGE